MSNTKKANTYRLTGLGILTAIIIVLQIFTTFVRFGPFSITLALIPIVVGAAMYGKGAGAYLGAVFSAVVVIMCITGGDLGGAMVWAANPAMCVVLCMFKGTAAGFLAGLLYQLVAPKNKLVGVILAALISPIANTGIFIIGMLLFFKDTLAAWAGGSDLLTYIILGLTGVNFLVELGVNMILSPVVVKIIDAVKKTNKAE
ncbi:MAG: ECF transporter S component [Ruminococcus sp.]|nr:ECF transporter S component [Ruminococcus sp.]